MANIKVPDSDSIPPRETYSELKVIRICSIDDGLHVLD